VNTMQSVFKSMSYWAQWYKPITSAIQEAEIGGLPSKASPQTKAQDPT
jgi:hypothetical protein